MKKMFRLLLIHLLKLTFSFHVIGTFSRWVAQVPMTTLHCKGHKLIIVFVFLTSIESSLAVYLLEFPSVYIMISNVIESSVLCPIITLIKQTRAKRSLFLII